MYRTKTNKQSGFTIIEVMIVLAVAGLIMAIVFLAVPALQRNNRNSQRNADASRVLGAIGECMAAKNGQVASCDTVAELDPAYITIGNNQQLINPAMAGGFPANTNTINIAFATGCNPTGDNTVTGAAVSARAYAVMYLLETSAGTTNKCLAS